MGPSGSFGIGKLSIEWPFIASNFLERLPPVGAARVLRVCSGFAARMDLLKISIGDNN